MPSRVLSFLLILSAVPVYGQVGQKSVSDQTLDKLVLQVKAQPDADHRVPIVINAANFVGYVVAFKAEAESTMSSVT
jgi:hypothetical protein